MAKATKPTPTPKTVATVVWKQSSNSANPIFSLAPMELLIDKIIREHDSHTARFLNDGVMVLEIPDIREVLYISYVKKAS